MTLTETHIDNASEVLQLAALLDHRVPTPEPSRVHAWAQQLARHPRINRDELLDAVQAFYDAPSTEPIGVGDVIGRARQIHNGRVDRDPDVVPPRGNQLAAAELTAIAPGPKPADTPDLAAARNALQDARGRAEVMLAIHAYTRALRTARRRT